MKTKLFAFLTVAFLCFALVSCATAEPAAAPKAEAPAAEAAPTDYAVIVTKDGVDTGFDKLEDAVASVKSGSAVITVKKDLTITKKMEINKAEITIIDGGTPVTITDGLTRENFVEYNGNDICCCFRITEKGRLILKGTETGGLTFKGAGSTAAITARILFYVGIGWKDPANEIHGYLEFNKGVTVTNVYSTTFGGLARTYGELVINGGTFTDNVVMANGVFCVYGDTTINDCVLANNDTNKVGIIQGTNCETTKITVNGGLFENNTSATRGAVINTYATTTLVINGGTFRNNTCYAEGKGGAIYFVGLGAINGGTFENNSSCDVFVAKGVTLTKAENLPLNIIQAE